jgi:hypothetical protein
MEPERSLGELGPSTAGGGSREVVLDKEAAAWASSPRSEDDMLKTWRLLALPRRSPPENADREREGGALPPSLSDMTVESGAPHWWG